MIASITYYNVPLSLFAVYAPDTVWPVFLNDIARDKNYALTVLLFVASAVALLHVGSYIGKRSPSVFKSFWYFRIDAHLQLRAVIAMFGATAVLVLGIILFGAGAFLSGYNFQSTSYSASDGNAMIFISVEIIGMAMLLWAVGGAHNGRFRFKTAVAGIICLLIALAIIRGKRLEIMIAFIPVALYLWAGRFRSLRLRIAFLAIALVILSALASFRFGELPTFESLLFNTVSEGLYAGHASPGIINGLESNSIRFEYGWRFLYAVLAVVPRFLFPSKDETVYYALNDLSAAAPLGATSLLAEVYLQGGFAGIVIVFLVLGFTAEKLMRAASSSGYYGAGIVTVAFLSYVVLIASFVPHFRDGVIPSVKISLQLLFFSLAILGMTRAGRGIWAICRSRRVN